MQMLPPKLIVMGVSGCGKSTLAAGSALALGCPPIEGDDLHLPESQARMRQPLRDRIAFE
jgi:gluconate kinase